MMLLIQRFARREDHGAVPQKELHYEMGNPAGS